MKKDWKEKSLTVLVVTTIAALLFFVGLCTWGVIKIQQHPEHPYAIFIIIGIIILSDILTKPRKKREPKNPFVLSDEQLQQMTDDLDGTCGWLIKDSELKYWIAKFVNEDREQR